ncbi:MAG TPA: Na+/H+ antiporter [Ohtaekwangia sp.]|uniref:Na+/H+ antiporter n=1 Tax=Ohtaekwangia sp. TaxID=2066019 RepID=UPI002F923FFE
MQTDIPSVFTEYIILVGAILVLVMLAQKLKIAYPIVLVIGGLILSFLPAMPAVSIRPEMIFIIFLPPLLYEAAWYTSWKEFWRWRRVISSFAFIVVIVTSFVIALVSSSVIPGFTMALGFLLGGIISPPDAVSASAILKYVKVPRRMSSILEGESLLNDASSLVVFRFALIAVDTGRFVFHEAALNFVVVIAAGIAIGVAIGMVYFIIHKWLPTDSNIDIVLSLSAPYVMYLTAEHFHFSGVLAVVSGGLYLSARSHLYLSHRSRLQGGNVWSAVSFVFNGLVFMMIGLELPDVVHQLGTVSLVQAILYGLLISVVLMIIRIACTVFASYFTVFISRYITTADSSPGLRAPFVIGWAGMRGVVSLAAALSVPLYLSDGTAFPQRNMILFITFTVILFTLIVQGLTLPLIIQWMKLEDRDKHLPVELQGQKIMEKLTDKSLRFLQEENNEVLQKSIPLQQLKARLENDLEDLRASVDHNEFPEVYLRMLEQQRTLLHELNKDPGLEEEVIRKYHSMLDMEEERIRVKYSKYENQRG